MPERATYVLLCWTPAGNLKLRQNVSAHQLRRSLDWLPLAPAGEQWVQANVPPAVQLLMRMPVRKGLPYALHPRPLESAPDS